LALTVDGRKQVTTNNVKTLHLPIVCKITAMKSLNFNQFKTNNDTRYFIES
jgi:hypothetical protein